MITLYKKVEKTKDNPSGIVEINDISQLDNPFLFCISAQDNVDKSIYGIIREGAQGARVYTTQERAAGYKTDEMPVDFIGVRYSSKDGLEKANEIVDKFLYPFLTCKGKDVEALTNRARLMNFMTYCDGTVTYKEIEKYLETKLVSDGLSKENIAVILSQVKLAAIGTMVDTSSLKGTTMTFVDLNDTEIMTDTSAQMMSLLNGRNSIYGTMGNTSNGAYYYNGNGNHDLKEYFSSTNIVKPVLSYYICKFLESSIHQKPISLYDLMNGVRPYLDESKSVEELLGEIDSSIDYGNVPKYTIGEATIRKELDETYSDLLKTQSKLTMSAKTEKSYADKMKNVIDNLKKYSSDTTFLQVLCSAGLWQAPRGVDPYSVPSDREIRESVELLSNSEEKNTGGPKF